LEAFGVEGLQQLVALVKNDRISFHVEGASFPSLKLLLQHTHDHTLLTHKVPLLLLKLNHSPLKFCKIFVQDTLLIHKVPPLLLKLNHSRLKFYEIFTPDED
jgi:hypothetical protein